MFGSVFGIVVNSFLGHGNQQDIIEYEGLDFIYQQGLWYTTVSDINFAFMNHPSQTSSIVNNLNPLIHYNGRPLYVYSEDADSEIELYRNLQQISGRMQPACLSEDECPGDFPLKTCSDNFILVEVSEESGITQSDNCVYIRGNSEELLELTDEFLFKTIGIK